MVHGGLLSLEPLRTDIFFALFFAFLITGRVALILLDLYFYFDELCLALSLDDILVENISVTSFCEKPHGILSSSKLCKFIPCLPRDLEVHFGQEWVDVISFADNRIFEVLILDNGQLTLCFQGLSVYLILGSQLEYLHLLADFIVSVFSPHTSIEKLIEIYETILTFDAHF